MIHEIKEFGVRYKDYITYAHNFHLDSPFLFFHFYLIISFFIIIDK